MYTHTVKQIQINSVCTAYQIQINPETQSTLWGGTNPESLQCTHTFSNEYIYMHDCHNTYALLFI